jgi:hypothetical protein
MLAPAAFHPGWLYEELRKLAAQKLAHEKAWSDP